MLVWDFVRTCLKRWYIIVAGLLLTAVGVYGTYQNTPITYEATASLVLIPPKDSVVIGDNPYLYLGGLDQALGVVSVRMTSPDVTKLLRRQYPDSTFTVAKDMTTTGPIMAINVTGSDAGSTLSLLGSVVDLVPRQLADLQEALNVPKGSRIGSLPLAQDDEPTALTKDRLRAVLVIGAAGATLTLLLTAGFDRLMISRRDRRSRRSLLPKKGKAKREPHRVELADSPERNTRKVDGEVPAALTTNTRDRGNRRAQAHVVKVDRELSPSGNSSGLASESTHRGIVTIDRS